MPNLSAIPFRWWPTGLLFLALAGCHEAPRKNPFDPELTPARMAASMCWTPAIPASEGYIYVADVFNQRIQVFAP